MTRDISTAGAFIVTNEVPMMANMEVYILLPWFDDTHRGLQLRGQGRVARVEPNGFAVAASLEPEPRT